MDFQLLGDGSASALPQELCREWDRFLPIDRWLPLLSSWAGALAAYGTDLRFAGATEFDSITTFSVDGETFQGRTFHWANLEVRNRLMREAWDPRSNSSSTSACLLCRNIAVANEALLSGAVSPVILDLDTHFVLPNRYPSVPGAMLFLGKHHDDPRKRVGGISDGNRRRYPIVDGATRGALISEGTLTLLMEVCDAFDLLGARNHVMDGMSIPEHDHWHLYPGDLPSTVLIPSITDTVRGAELDIRVDLPGTPFSTLQITGPKVERARAAAHIVNSLERHHQVFSLLYFRGSLLISPKINVGEEAIRVGSGILTHCFPRGTIQPHLDSNLLRHIPRRGHYPWERYLP